MSAPEEGSSHFESLLDEGAFSSIVLSTNVIPTSFVVVRSQYPFGYRDKHDPSDKTQNDPFSSPPLGGTKSPFSSMG